VVHASNSADSSICSGTSFGASWFYQKISYCHAYLRKYGDAEVPIQIKGLFFQLVYIEATTEL